jgi:thioredoxin
MAARNRKLPPSFFELIRTAEVPVLVEFWAEWCEPCRIVRPTVERIASDYAGRMLTVRVDIDRRPRVAEQFTIDSIPTIMLFWKGEPAMRLTGAQPYQAIREEIERHWPVGAD